MCYEINYTFLFFIFFFSFPKVIWRRRGGRGVCIAPIWSQPYKYNYTCQRDISFLLSKVNSQSHLISNLSHMLCGHHYKYKRI